MKNDILLHFVTRRMGVLLLLCGVAGSLAAQRFASVNLPLQERQTAAGVYASYANVVNHNPFSPAASGWAQPSYGASVGFTQTYAVQPLQRRSSSLQPKTVGAGVAASSPVGFAAIASQPAMDAGGIAVLPSSVGKRRAGGWNPLDPDPDNPDDPMHGNPNGAAPVGDAVGCLLALAVAFALYCRHRSLRV